METLGFGKQVKNSNSTSSIIQDRYEVRNLFLETFSSKLYIGIDLITGKEVMIKFIKITKLNPHFEANYTSLDSGVVPELLSTEVKEDSQRFVFEMKGHDLQAMLYNNQSGFSPITVTMIFHLTILLLEKVHAHNLVHTNLKLSKLAIGNKNDEESLYLLGLELCEKIVKPLKNEKPKLGIRKIRSYENIFSSLSVHTGDPIGYKDDLESLSYIVIYLFTNGKFFKKISKGSNFPKNKKEELLDQKANILSEILLSGIPLEIFDFIKYITRLKPTDMPNYEYIKGLSLKLCQRFYVNKNIISCLDWVKIPDQEQNQYRSRMLSYFFCSNIPQLKKNRTNRVDELGNSKRGKNYLKLTLTNINSNELLVKNFQGMPIHEIPNESAEASRVLDNFQIDYDDYVNFPPTARLSLSTQVYIQEKNNNRLVSNFTLQDEEDSFGHKSGLSEVSESSFDSLDDNISLLGDEGVSIIAVSNKLLGNKEINSPEAVATRSETSSSTKTKRENKLPPSMLKPESLQCKMMPK